MCPLGGVSGVWGRGHLQCSVAFEAAAPERQFGMVPPAERKPFQDGAAGKAGRRREGEERRRFRKVMGGRSFSAEYIYVRKCYQHSKTRRHKE